MKSMEEMIKAAQAAAETIQKHMGEAQATLDSIEVEEDKECIGSR